MKKNLVIFCHQNFITKNDWKILEIERYKKIADVIIFEFGKIINPDFEKVFKNRKKNEVIKRIDNIETWKIKLNKAVNKNYKKRLIINSVKPRKRNSLIILKELSKLNIPILELENFHLPYNENFKNSFADIIIKLLSLRYLSIIIKSKFYNFCARELKFKNQYILVNGEKNKINYKNKKVLPGLVREYDLALNEDLKIIKKKYILFIENESPKSRGDSNFFPGIFSANDDFYDKLTNFFNYVENKFNCKIIISAHPKSNHLSHPSYFGGRQVIKNRTNSLVRNAKLILTQPSMAISYVIFHKKPSLIIFSKCNTKSKYFMNQINNVKNFIGINSINFENEDEWQMINKHIKLDKKKIIRYEHNYLCPKNKKEGNFLKIRKLFL